MIYLPTIYNGLQNVNYLILSDPVIYMWVYWQQQEAIESLGKPLEIRREKWQIDLDQAQTRFWRGFYMDNPPHRSPFVTPPI